MTIVRTYQSFRKADGYVFPVTAEVVTAESAEAGDAEARGYCDYWGQWSDDPDLWDLRHLLDDLPSGYVEGDGSAVPRWITVCPDSDWFLSPICQELAGTVDGDALGVTLSVHRPPQLTDASWLRVCRALGWEGRS